MVNHGIALLHAMTRYHTVDATRRNEKKQQATKKPHNLMIYGAFLPVLQRFETLRNSVLAETERFELSKQVFARLLS
jgi:hypothetical protein